MSIFSFPVLPFALAPCVFLLASKLDIPAAFPLSSYRAQLPSARRIATSSALFYRSPSANTFSPWNWYLCMDRSILLTIWTSILLLPI